MKKPSKETKEYYDYHKCRDYLHEKYSYDERDYAGTYGKPAKNSKAVKALGKIKKDDRPYWDFWHHVIKQQSIQNGCFFWMGKEWLDGHNYDVDNWKKEIINHYLDEFGDEKGEIYFYVWW